MIVRHMIDADAASVERLHQAMKMPYRLPDFGPLYVVKNVAQNGSPEIIAAAGIKLIGEAFLWISPSESVMKRVEAINQLSARCLHDARAAGLDEVSAWIPAEMEPRFAPMLESLGWQKSPWPTWGRLL